MRTTTAAVGVLLPLALACMAGGGDRGSEVGEEPNAQPGSALACPDGAIVREGVPGGSAAWYRPEVLYVERGEQAYKAPDRGTGALIPVPELSDDVTLAWCDAEGTPHGPVRYGWSTGVIGTEVVGRFSEGKPDGRWVGTHRFDEGASESPAFVGHFDHGVQVGEWKVHCGVGCQGDWIAVGTYAAGKPHGAWTYEGDMERMVANYRHGLLHGDYHHTFFETVVEGRFERGKRVGVWTTSREGEVTEKDYGGGERRRRKRKAGGPGR